MKLKLKRLFAAYIDIGLIIICSSILADLITLRNFNLNAPIGLLILAIIIFFGFTYYFWLLKDLMFKNASFGKKILGLGIFYENGKIPSFKILINRNRSSISIFYPIQILYILINNRTSGDKKYNTIVTLQNKN